MKRAVIFPGQGAQKEGMGKGLYDRYEEIRSLYSKISDSVGFDVADASFGSSAHVLGKTGAAQPAIFAHSLACYEAFRMMGGKAEAAAGFSLGECTAVCASGALGIEDAARMIAARAMTMQHEAEASSGAMYAILGADEPAIREAIRGSGGYCEMVNFNCPGQVVIAGEDAACAKAAADLSSKGYKANRLNVNAAFHSRLMAPAADGFANKLAGMNWRSPQIELYSNLTGALMDFTRKPEEYFPLQMLSPVRWQGLVEGMIRDGYEEFVELGPSRTLSGMIRRISRDVKVMNAETPEELEAILHRSDG